MMIAALLHAMPLSRRLVLFLVPLLLLVLGEALDEASGLLARVGPVLAGVGAAALVACAILTTVAELPEYRDELRPVLEEVRRRAEPGDAIYVYNGAVRAFQYYAPRLGLSDLPTTLGCCSDDRWPIDVDALRRLGGRRVWLVMTRWYGGEASFLTLALDHFGRRLAAIRAPGAAAYGYALREVTPGEYEEVLSVIPPDRRVAAPPWQCTGGILYDPSCAER
jgi:hypothetical protein